MPRKKKMMKAKSACACPPYTYSKYMAVKLLVIGVLIVLNAQLAWLTWPNFVGWVLVLLGLVKLVIPCCK